MMSYTELGFSLTLPFAWIKKENKKKESARKENKEKNLFFLISLG